MRSSNLSYKMFRLLCLCLAAIVGDVLAQNYPSYQQQTPQNYPNYPNYPSRPPLTNLNPQLNCPQPNGTFPLQGECRRYLVCSNGLGKVETCQGQLVFNPDSRTNIPCDYPAAVQNPSPSCSTDTILVSTVRNACRESPYPSNWGFHVALPNYCNVFLTCVGYGFLHQGCTVCANGTYYSQELGGCRSIVETGLSRDDVCRGTRYVEPEEVNAMRLSCWWLTDPNPFGIVQEDVKNRGGRVEPEFRDFQNNPNTQRPG